MKTFLTILIIFALLVLTIFVLLRRSKNDNELDDSDADYEHCPGSDGNPCDIEEPDDTPIEEEEAVEEPAVPEDSEEEHAEPITESELDDGKVVEEPDVVEGEEEEISFQGCKDKEEKDMNIINKYFFYIHKYTTARNRLMFCIVCSALINGKNYKIIVNRSFYPYETSYTQSVLDKLVEKYTPNMTVEEFLKTGSTKFDRVGDSISLVAASVD